MGHQSCCVKQKLRKGLWSPEEDEKLFNHITRHGVGCWSSVPKLAGLQRCGKSCRLRWINYLRPDLKRGMFSQEEEDLILSLHESLGNRWAQIATRLPGRTDNEIKNYWNSCLKKKLMNKGIDPNTHKPMQGKEDDREKDVNVVNSVVLQQSNNPTRMAYHPDNAVFTTDTVGLLSPAEHFVTKQCYDSLFLSELDQDPCQQNLLRPFMNPNCGIPNSKNCSLQNDPSSDSSASRYLMSIESKESSSNSPIANTFPWDNDTKLEPIFQFPFGATIQSEEEPLTSLAAAGNLDAAFQQMYNKLD